MTQKQALALATGLIAGIVMTYAAGFNNWSPIAFAAGVLATSLTFYGLCRRG